MSRRARRCAGCPHGVGDHHSALVDAKRRCDLAGCGCAGYRPGPMVRELGAGIGAYQHVNGYGAYRSATKTARHTVLSIYRGPGGPYCGACDFAVVETASLRLTPPYVWGSR